MTSGRRDIEDCAFLAIHVVIGAAATVDMVLEDTLLITEAIDMKPSRRKGAGSVVVAVTLLLAVCSVAVARVQQKPATVPPDHATKMAEGLALFKDRVRPLLITQCLECHGGKAKKGDLDLSDRKLLMESGVIEGGGKASRIYALITHAEEPHMPSEEAEASGRGYRSARSMDRSGRRRTTSR